MIDVCKGCGGLFDAHLLEYGMCSDCREDALDRFCKLFADSFTDTEQRAIDAAVEGEWLRGFARKEG